MVMLFNTNDFINYNINCKIYNIGVFTKTVEHVGD